jgi:hypothetical protein
MECWSAGVLECWSAGVLECWSVGVLECWCGDGVLGKSPCNGETEQPRALALGQAPNEIALKGRPNERLRHVFLGADSSNRSAPTTSGPPLTPHSGRVLGASYPGLKPWAILFRHFMAIYPTPHQPHRTPTPHYSTTPTPGSPAPHNAFLKFPRNDLRLFA